MGTLVAGSHGQLLAALGGGAGALVQHSPLGFVVAFGAGIVSFVSPCVLPLVPSYLSMMSGVGVSAVAGAAGANGPASGGAGAGGAGAGGAGAGGAGAGGAVAVQAGVARAGLTPAGGAAAGTLQTGTLQTGTLQTGTLETGTLQTATFPTSAVQTGTVELSAAGAGYGHPVGNAATAYKGRLLLSTLLFVAGFSFVFALLEATASALFHPLQSHKPILGDIAGALIVAMGALLAFQLPWLQREHRVNVQPSKLGPWVAPVMGMTFAFAWTPCITPVLAAVLGLASSGGTLARGEEMLVAYSLGLGVPFVLTGLAFGRLSGALRFARRHSRAVSVASGAVLAALGVLIITGQVGTVSSWSSSILQHIGLGGLATG